MAANFFKTNRSTKPHFSNAAEQTTAEDAGALAGATGQGDANSGTPRPTSDLTHNFNYRKLCLFPPKESLDDLLEKLLRNAESAEGNARYHLLEKMLHLLKRNPQLVNRIPNKFHSNPLELALNLGDFRIAAELIKLHAHVRSEHKNLIKQFETYLGLKKPNAAPSLNR